MKSATIKVSKLCRQCAHCVVYGDGEDEDVGCLLWRHEFDMDSGSCEAFVFDYEMLDECGIVYPARSDIDGDS